MISTAGTVVTGTEVFSPGWIEHADGQIVAVGPGARPRPAGRSHSTGPAVSAVAAGSGVPAAAAERDYGDDAIIVPGFVDLHVHGGGGHALTSHDLAEVLAAVAFHRSRGTTRTLASLVTADEATLLRSVRLLAGLARDGEIAGIHLEGPWLNPARRGAHDQRLLSTPDPALLERLLEAGGGTVAMITLAPELPGGLDLVARIVDAGVVAAIGHTDATFEQTIAAIDAGATVATHLFNAMPPVHHRRPGPVVALLADPRVTLELIADGVHQHPAILDLVRAAAGPARIALVTDAMAAAGMPDGDYSLGPLDVQVRDRVARVRGTGSIAGSTTTMDALFRAAAGEQPGPAALLAAAAMTSATPAAALGLTGPGLLAPGRPSDFVVLGAFLEVRAVVRGRAD